MEFGSAEECKAARGRLATTQYKGKELIVDFVGEVSTTSVLIPVILPNLINLTQGEQEQVTEGEI